ncbi:MAG: 50S ribosomal protein L9 [Chloroflexota bacterium]|nr:50S ribosomal protein L9 [Chloroflexota bacterium]
MKVILTRDVRGVGREGDIKDVRDGYARNFLLPQKAAVLADSGAIKNWERHRGRRDERDRALREQAEATAARLSELKLEIAVRAGDKNRLFGSVTNREIADLIAREGIDVDRHSIAIAEPIKTVGDHRVTVHLMPGVDAQVSVTVTPQRSER